MMDLKRLKTNYFPEVVDEHQCKDSGMALVLICLLIGFWAGRSIFIFFSILLLILNMTVPTLYRGFAKIWLGLSQILGTVVSKIVLTMIFFLMVTPIGVLRRRMGKDSLQVKDWKKGADSAFAVRDHVFHADEIEKPY